MPQLGVVRLDGIGLAFVSEGGFDLGSTLELKMVLPPALVGLIAYGRVVSCQSTGFGDGGVI